MNTSASDIELSEADLAFLAGDFGDAAKMSMRILITMAGVFGAKRLLDIEQAHIDGCLFHGDSGLDFAEKLVAGGGSVRVPTTLNVGAFDQIHPENFQGDDELARRAKRLMECYVEMGCEATFTCAPYQTRSRVPLPKLGQQVAWAESNAIVFANSVLGARTNRYGDFIDICAAITGRAPAVGLHLDEGRRGQKVVDLTQLPPTLRGSDVFFPVLGYWLGENSGNRIPVLVGLPEETNQDQLKALGASAASSGSVALFHAVNVTPEAPSLDVALQGQPPEETVVLTVEDLRETLGALSTLGEQTVEQEGLVRVNVIALGSPHFSVPEFRQLMPLLEQDPPASGVEFVVCTSRFVQWALDEQGWSARLAELGVRVVVDTCVVVAPILETAGGVLMTNSGKFAHYTPGNIGFEVVFGSLKECVRSASCGKVWRDPELWTSHG